MQNSIKNEGQTGNILRIDSRGSVLEARVMETGPFVPHKIMRD